MQATTTTRTTTLRVDSDFHFNWGLSINC